MTICAYMIHECGHNTVLRSNDANAYLGRFLNWICGTSYGTFEDIRYKHFRHHLDNDDAVWFMCDEYLERARAGQIYGGNAVSFLNSF